MNDLERCAQLVRDRGLSAGQAETHEDLMREVLAQVEGLRSRIRVLEEAIRWATQDRRRPMYGRDGPMHGDEAG